MLLNQTSNLVNRTINLFLIFLTAVIIGCGKEDQKKDYIAKVNDSYLTPDQLSELTDTSSGGKFFVSEIIRNWIDQELLYQEAVRKGIIDEDEFNRIVIDSKKSLAAAWLLKEVYDAQDIVYELTEVEDYFLDHQEEFRLMENSYVLNIAEFNDEDEAIKFRTEVFETGWQNANDKENNNALLKNQTGLFLNEDEIYPLALSRIVSELYPQEVSIVISDGSNSFTIVQLIEKYEKGTIPPFEFIKSKVENRFLALKKEEFMKKYMETLYSDNDIEVKKAGEYEN